MILKNMTSWFLVRLDSSVSHSRRSNIDVTLLVGIPMGTNCAHWLQIYSCFVVRGTL